MVARASKHVLRRLLDAQPGLRAAPASALAAFLNGLLGSGGYASAAEAAAAGAAAAAAGEGSAHGGASSSNGGGGNGNGSKKKKKKGGSGGGEGSSGPAGGSAAAVVVDPLDLNHLWALSGGVVAAAPPLPEGLASGRALWTLIATEVECPPFPPAHSFSKHIGMHTETTPSPPKKQTMTINQELVFRPECSQGISVLRTSFMF
jgi:hypothetical protein